ncbi:putative c6 transcription [Diaporthe ampelina]|uniref:Putative c6 transcription n=1 Tax=Diaporthe ampelina TaxID=1214573 RepID=A0A0G2FF53_9PEZI|nr:putative c6 transcription [Diaporthe ampelina]
MAGSIRVSLPDNESTAGADEDSFLQLVESRLSQLESDVRSLKSQQSEGGSVPDSTTVDRRPSVQIHRVTPTVHEADSEESGVSPDATDGIGSIEFTKEDDSGYYDDEMDALVDRFFRDTGALFPFVHPQTFMETYRHTKSIGFRRSRRSWLGLLNSVLAMAIFTSGSWSSTATERGAKAEVFFTRAKSLCLDQMLSGSSLETVQAMLLMSQYLQGTHRSVMTWNMHGIAVKAAFQLGLHSTTSLKAYTPLERETRTRTWFACVLLDRTLSMTFGRPPAIPDSYIRTPPPQPYSGSDILPNSEFAVDDAMSIHFFVSTMWVLTGIPSSMVSLLIAPFCSTLYKIMWTIIDRLYDCNIAYPENSVISTASQILEIEHQLLEWQASLPPLLSLTNPAEIRSDNDFSLERRFRVILTLRHHNVRLLAHRRIFDLYLASIERGRGYDSHESMLIQIGERSKNACLQTASELISIVNLITHSPQPKCGLLGAWWFTLYYTLNAALTIVTMALCNHPNTPIPAAPCEAGGISDQALRDALAEALACLPLIDKDNRMVEKCAMFVATLQQSLNLLVQTGLEEPAPARPGTNGNMPMGTPRGSQNGQFPQVPVPIDAVNLDLTALGWETESFLSSLNAGFMEGFQDADLFC